VELLDELHTAGKQTRENQQAHAKGNSYSYLRANPSSLQLFLAYEKRKTCDISDLKLYVCILRYKLLQHKFWAME